MKPKTLIVTLAGLAGLGAVAALVIFINMMTNSANPKTVTQHILSSPEPLIRFGVSGGNTLPELYEAVLVRSHTFDPGQQLTAYEFNYRDGGNINKPLVAIGSSAILTSGDTLFYIYHAEIHHPFGAGQWRHETFAIGKNSGDYWVQQGGAVLATSQ